LLKNSKNCPALEAPLLDDPNWLPAAVVLYVTEKCQINIIRIFPFWARPIKISRSASAPDRFFLFATVRTFRK